MIEERLQELGLELPAAVKPVYEYAPVVIHGGVAYVSGQLPKAGDDVRHKGKVGAEVSLEEAQDDARLCVLHALACLRQALGGDLGRIERILKVTGFVASASGFNDQPKVIDAASKLLGQLLGEQGRHARSAVGVIELPRNTPVEIEFIVAVKG
jgi:enamine deaminase RidA (YjgF/YER057c/UK114 family)